MCNSFWNDVTWDRQAKREDGLEQSTHFLSYGLCSLSAHTVILIYHLADVDKWNIRFWKQYKMPRFIIGRFKVVKIVNLFVYYYYWNRIQQKLQSYVIPSKWAIKQLSMSSRTRNIVVWKLTRDLKKRHLKKKITPPYLGNRLTYGNKNRHIVVS